MWPWGHAAVGYLLYTLLTRVRDGHAPTGAAVLWLALGTQFPDLADKPLAWTFGILPAGRTLTHTLLISVPLCAASYALARRWRRSEWAIAFGVGYLAHIVADALPSLLWGELVDARFLLWPVLPAPPTEGSDSVLTHFATIEPTGYLLVQLGLTAVATAAWWLDGRPGIEYCLDRFRTLRATVH